jgi:hypothetical protein
MSCPDNRTLFCGGADNFDVAQINHHVQGCRACADKRAAFQSIVMPQDVPNGNGISNADRAVLENEIERVGGEF